MKLPGIEEINRTAPGLGPVFQGEADPKGVITLRFEGHFNLGIVLLGQFVVGQTKHPDTSPQATRRHYRFCHFQIG